MLIMTETGMLGDCGIAPSACTYQILKWTAIEKLCWRKVLFLSIGAGPICHPLNR